VIAAAVQGLLDLLLPPRCAACGRESFDAPASGLCGPCAGALPALEPRCVRCARPRATEAPADGCGACSGPWATDEVLGARDGTARRPLDRVLAAWPYAGVARDLVLALKFRSRRLAARPLAEAMRETLEAAGVPGDLVVGVPLSRRRLRERGYDQARLLAVALARGARLPWDRRALARRRHTARQTELSRRARRRGPRGAFVGEPRRVRGRCVVLVDDVLTTGATARACAVALKRAGAATVTLVVACRTA
jgi:ComF family protein